MGKIVLKIQIAKKAGFCFGVRRAVELAEKSVKQGLKTYTLGPIIHNPQEVKRLEDKNIQILKSLKNIKNATIVLRAHGIPSGLNEKLKKNKTISIVDAVCPFVKRAQEIVKTINAKQQDAKSKNIAIIGERKHPEIIALISYDKNACTVIESNKDAQNFKSSSKIVDVVSQTTQSQEKLDTIVKILKKHYCVRVHNTICKATFDRQNAAEKLAKKVELMIVVGGKNSGNTNRLAQICSKWAKTKLIETAEDIRKVWFKNILKIGLTAGASTPDWIIENVKGRVKEILKTSEKTINIKGDTYDRKQQHRKNNF
ncbi:MAG: 4-hydroxy-3-methylbut-2-enyl diphosphate reductase [Elusimicrobiota bacterium]|jgi:4-hydroxy-3-methylbut-2-enyl diphosphate reductase|nr:4-hydroxy-3-methylbut-2-enyl diphosphate reductase [Elusimicrobiota bacterium]